MIETLSYEYDLLTDVSWVRFAVVATSLVGAWRIEGGVGWRMLTTAWLATQVAEAVGLFGRVPLNVTGWWIIFGVVPYVAVRPELRRMVIAVPRQVTMLLPRLVTWLRARRAPPSDGALKNSEALKLLRDEGWRPGYVQVTVTDAEGRTHTIWAPPQRLPLGMRMHGWLAFAPTVALCGFVLWLLYVTPPWARPIAAAGVGIGVLGHLGLLPNPLHWIGL